MMLMPLLTTKLNTPPLRPNLVPRPRLLQKLDEGLRAGRRLTLVSAPAGYGKTTLVTEWLHSLQTRDTDRAFTWLSLDDDDNDPARFLAYLVAALRKVDCECAQAIDSVLQSPQLPPPIAFMTALINEISAHVPGFVLTLDDCHLVTAPIIYDMLDFLLDNMPPRMHLICITRADPPLSLSRLRARGELTEMRADRLRFTADETTLFLTHVMGLDLTPQQIGALGARTEGWAAGVQLAALSLQSLHHDDDVAEFVEAFAGSYRYVMDYLVEQVFSHQPPHVQSFLLQTSILDRLSGPLCDALTGQTDGQETLERLEQINLFTVPLGHDRRWYRYHRLFADLLRDRLQRAQPQVIPELHRHASRWYEGNEMLAQAFAHALAAEDHDTAARLVEQAGEPLLRRGELGTLLRWIEGLPDDLVRSRPDLSRFCAWALLFAGQVEGVEPRLQDVERALTSEARRIEWGETRVRNVLGEVTAIRAYIAYFSGDATRMIDLAQEALKHLSERNLIARSIVVAQLGSAYLLRGDMVRAEEALAESIRIGQAGGNPSVTVNSTCSLAGLQAAKGQLHQAAETYRQALRLATELYRQPLPVAAGAHLGLSHLLYEWDDLEAATRHILEGTELSKQWGDLGAMTSSYVSLARVRQAQGDLNGALELLRQAHQIVRQHTVSLFTDTKLAARCISLWLARGNAAAAARCAAEHRLSADDERAYVRELEREAGYLVLVRLLVAQGELHKAVEWSTRLLRTAEALGRMSSVIKILVLQALAFQVRGDTGRGTAALERALSLAEREGYVRTFVDAGPPIAELLQRALSRGLAPNYVRRLLVAFRETPAAQPLVEPLTGRELEVLRLIVRGLQNQEIADQLVISKATVKRHISNIYGKLGVSRRTQAIVHAQELGLLRSSA
jgi:LuxR family maltose regulon positive regulatory protein